MAKRRMLRGKKLLVAAGIAATSMIGCDDDTVANLVAPPDSGEQMDANVPDDGDVMMPDAVVANLVAPPDSGFNDSGMDSGTDDAGSDAGGTGDSGTGDSGTDDAGSDADMPDDAAVIGFPDAPVANLLPPPDGSAF